MSDRVLFISGRCPHCKKILLGFQQHAFLKSLFKVINIDREAYPNYVKSVPSILIHNQIVTGEKVFQYFGKLVDGKMQQEKRINDNQLNDSDQGQCRINEDGELEGWCSNNSNGVEYSLITEDNDDYTKKTYKIESNYDLLDGANDSMNVNQISEMEKNDSRISEKQKSFDSDLERMQKERGQLLQSQSGPGGMGRPPPGLDNMLR